MFLPQYFFPVRFYKTYIKAVKMTENYDKKIIKIWKFVWLELLVFLLTL